MSDWFRRYGFADVHDGLIVGALPLDRADVRMLERLGVTRVLNLVDDREYADGSRAQVEAALAAAGILEERLRSEDFGALRPELLESSAQLLNGWLDEGRTVYLHCRAGWQRSATVAAAALATRQDIDPDSALRAIRARRASAAPLPHQIQSLRTWWNSRLSSPADQAPPQPPEPRR